MSEHCDYCGEAVKRHTGMRRAHNLCYYQAMFKKYRSENEKLQAIIDDLAAYLNQRFCAHIVEDGACEKCDLLRKHNLLEDSCETTKEER